jgi:hypothetical protein
MVIVLPVLSICVVAVALHFLEFCHLRVEGNT